ncbi:MAG TPA: mechanosensitive ion channel domain-containing protein [Bryobacteraceae bacterium]|nr:mechanosensitive ion channel domain-containing protein [Bryobacteraceae bacterium]
MSLPANLSQYLAWKWPIVIGAFFVLTFIFLALSRIVLRLIRRVTGSRREWMEALLRAFSPALNIAAVVLALVVALSFEPIPSRWNGVIAGITSAGTILALVVFADGLLIVWMGRAAVRFPVLGGNYGLITGLIRGLVFGLGALMFLESVGISIGPILATLGVGSLAVALALQETLKNTLSGFFVVIDKPLAMGDYVKLSSGQEGWLTELGWRSSKFRMMNDNVVVVPNSQLVDAILTNLRAPDGALSVEVDLNVAAGPDLQLIEDVTMETASAAMKSVNGNGFKFEPSVYFQSVSGSSLGLAVFLRVAESVAIEKVRHEFVKRVSEVYRQKDIKLA